MWLYVSEVAPGYHWLNRGSLKVRLAFPEADLRIFSWSVRVPLNTVVTPKLVVIIVSKSAREMGPNWAAGMV